MKQLKAVAWKGICTYINYLMLSSNMNESQGFFINKFMDEVIVNISNDERD